MPASYIQKQSYGEKVYLADQNIGQLVKLFCYLHLTQ